MDELSDLILQQAKGNLYQLLLSKENPTDNEIDIMYQLSIDSQVIEILEIGLSKIVNN